MISMNRGSDDNSKPTGTASRVIGWVTKAAGEHLVLHVHYPYTLHFTQNRVSEPNDTRVTRVDFQSAPFGFFFSDASTTTFLDLLYPTRDTLPLTTTATTNEAIEAHVLGSGTVPLTSLPIELSLFVFFFISTCFS